MVSLPKGWYMERKWTHGRDKKKPKNSLPLYVRGKVGSKQASIYVGERGMVYATKKIRERSENGRENTIPAVRKEIKGISTVRNQAGAVIPTN